MRLMLRFVVSFAVVWSGFGVRPLAAESPVPPAYLFTYFVGNGEDGLHLAASRDGLRWVALGGGRSYLKPEVGERKLMRDPHPVRGPDGTWHLVWTTAWEGKTIGHASTRDFVTWSEQQAIPVMAHEPGVRNCWAPEAVWDEAAQHFVIFWASTITERFPETAGTSESGYNHRMYYTTTKDWRTFTPTQLLYDPGFSVIDATFATATDGARYLIVKDETRTPPKKHLRVARAEGFTGPFGALAAPFTPDWVEGPTALRVGDATIVYYDIYREKRYGAKRTHDFVTWEDVTAQLSYPPGLRHGTAFEVPAEILHALEYADSVAASVTPVRRFDFGATTATAAAGVTPVTPDAAYAHERGYGFIAPRDLTLTPGGEAITAAQPFFFAVDLPEGNYRVTATFGAAGTASDNTVKAEARRLMLERVTTRAGERVERTFTVNVRRATLAAGGAVRLKSRELGTPTWDDRLTLEFNGAVPVLDALVIEPAPADTITVFLAGDSTVTDQDKEPWCAWGQMLPRFFTPHVAIANHAESGEAFRSFASAGRLAKILEQIRPGDYLFMQFGHNDQKEKGEGVGAFTTYTKSAEEFVAAARAKGAHPVLVTSMYRRRFDAEGKFYDTLGDFPAAIRRVAEAQRVPLIDLHTMSRPLFEALGPVVSKQAFVHYPAGTFPGQDKELKDDTHFSPYGGDLLARCVVRGIQQAVPALAAYLAADVPAFDPARPPPPESWTVPATPADARLIVPDGS